MRQAAAPAWLRGLLLGAACLGGLSAAADGVLLRHIADSLAQDSPIEHIHPAALADGNGMPSSPRPLLFDVREAGEFAVSHLPGAVRIDPRLDAEDFLERYGARLRGQTALFYCTTGQRSTALAERIQALLDARGIRDIRIANLYGGILHWHNEELPLVDTQGPTRRVHPYNWARKWLLDQPGAAAYGQE